MEENKMTPELSDITEMIKRYSAANKNDVCFVYAFLSFEKDPEHKCVDCGDDCERVRNEGSRLGAYGHLLDLREILDDLRDEVEDNIDKEGFVNL